MTYLLVFYFLLNPLSQPLFPCCDIRVRLQQTQGSTPPGQGPSAAAACSGPHNGKGSWASYQGNYYLLKLQISGYFNF